MDTISVVSDIRFDSITAPIDQPDLVGPTISVVRRALALGLIHADADAHVLDLKLIRGIAQEAARLGIGRDVALELQGSAVDPAQLPGLIRRLDAALAGSPAPERELAGLWRVLGPEPLAALLGVSVISLRRYVAGDRTPPDTVAARGHWLAFVVSDLAGAYNEIGVRRWFERPRAQLAGRSPSQALGTGWDPDDAAAGQVAQLAAALVGPGVAT